MGTIFYVLADCRLRRFRPLLPWSPTSCRCFCLTASTTNTEASSAWWRCARWDPPPSPDWHSTAFCVESRSCSTREIWSCFLAGRLIELSRSCSSVNESCVATGRESLSSKHLYLETVSPVSTGRLDFQYQIPEHLPIDLSLLP